MHDSLHSSYNHVIIRFKKYDHVIIILSEFKSDTYLYLERNFVDLNFHFARKLLNKKIIMQKL